MGFIGSSSGYMEFIRFRATQRLMGCRAYGVYRVIGFRALVFLLSGFRAYGPGFRVYGVYRV